jgi:hypothetical protein
MIVVIALRSAPSPTLPLPSTRNTTHRSVMASGDASAMVSAVTSAVLLVVLLLLPMPPRPTVLEALLLLLLLRGNGAPVLATLPLLQLVQLSAGA